MARDLRDPDANTFTDAELNDLLNYAVVEVGRVYPKEQVVELAAEQDAQNQWAIEAFTIFRVEVIQDSEVIFGIPQNTLVDAVEGGFDLHGGTLFIPKYIADQIEYEGTKTLRAWGYWPRETFAEDTDVLDGNAEFEYGVRTVGALLGYQRLQNDRMLFQQWMTNTGNTDISPNQLAQTADMYQSQWREMRNRLRTLQRT